MRLAGGSIAVGYASGELSEFLNSLLGVGFEPTTGGARIRCAGRSITELGTALAK